MWSATAFASVAASTGAQTFIDIDLRVAHDVLRPGEVQTVEVWASFTPFPTQVAPGITSIAFGGLIWDVLNTSGLETGDVGNPGYPSVQASLGERDHYGNIIKSGALNAVPPFFGTVYWNPIKLMYFDWTPDPDLGPRLVTIETASQPEYWQHIIIQNPPFSFPQYDMWRVDTLYHDAVSWKVIPAPAAALVLFAPLAARARRRRSP